MHNISLPPGIFGGTAIEEFFTNTLKHAGHPFFEQIASLRVSAHFFVRRNGELVQFVSTERRAWHAGISRWRGLVQCNDFSIGIEVEGADDVPYTAAQYRRLTSLLRALMRRYPTIDGVAGHSEISPDRKTDPGPAFDWGRLMAQTALPEGFREIT